MLSTFKVQKHLQKYSTGKDLKGKQVNFLHSAGNP